MSTYIVQPGDTLQSIAISQMGDESMTQYLASINQIKGLPGLGGGPDNWTYPVVPGQEIIVEVAEVQAKPNWIYVIIIMIVVVAAGSYFYFKG